MRACAPVCGMETCAARVAELTLETYAPVLPYSHSRTPMRRLPRGLFEAMIARPDLVSFALCSRKRYCFALMVARRGGKLRRTQSKFPRKMSVMTPGPPRLRRACPNMLYLVNLTKAGHKRRRITAARFPTMSRRDGRDRVTLDLRA